MDELWSYRELEIKEDPDWQYNPVLVAEINRDHFEACVAAHEALRKYGQVAEKREIARWKKIIKDYHQMGRIPVLYKNPLEYRAASDDCYAR